MSTFTNYMPVAKWEQEISLLGKSMAEQWKTAHALADDAVTYYHRSGSFDCVRIEQLSHVCQMNNKSMFGAFRTVVARTCGVNFKQENKDLNAPMSAKHSGKK